MYNKYVSTSSLKKHNNRGHKEIRLFNIPSSKWIKTEMNLKNDSKKDYLDSNSNYWNCSTTQNTQSSTHNLLSLKSNGSTFSVGDRINHAISIREKYFDDKREKIKNEIENKREKLIKKKKELDKIKQKKSERFNKVTEMRKIKLKIHRLSHHKGEQLCSSLDSKNYFFNQKVEEYFESDRFINKQINFHSTFRFGKEHYGDAHNRLNMIMNLDRITSMSADKLKMKRFENNFSEKEIDLINEDPNYFMNNKTVSGCKFLSRNTLAKRIEMEDKAEERKILKEKKRLEIAKKMTARNSIIRNNKNLFTSIIQKEANKTVNEKKFNWLTEKASPDKNKQNKDFMTRVKSKVNLALNRAHNEEIKHEIEQKQKRENIEKELRLMNYELSQTNKGTPMMTLENKRDHGLPASEKREFSLLSNSANLKKIKRKFYLNNKKNEEEKLIDQEKKVIQDYVSKLKDSYISKK